jgi:chromosome segregation ATPase
MENYMKILSGLLILTLIVFPNGLLYAEVILDKPITMGSSVRSIRTPQDIIADFQATVDKIQQEHQGLYNEIDSKNKENTFLLKKINDMSVRLLQLDYALSKKSNNTVNQSQNILALTAEKEDLSRKYVEAQERVQSLEQEILLLKEHKNDLELTEQESLQSLQSALKDSESKVNEQNEALDSLKKEKELLEKNRQVVMEEKTVLQGQLHELDVQLNEAKIKEEQKTELNQVPLQLRNRELSDHIDQLVKEIREKDNFIAKYKNQAVKAESELKKSLVQNNEISIQLRKVTSTYNTAQEGRSDKISRLESSLEESKKEIKNLTKANEEARSSLAGFESERKKLNKQINTLKEELKNNNVAQNSQQINTISNPAATKNEQQTNKMIADLKSKLEEKDSQLKNKSKALEDVTSQKKTLQDTIQSLEGQMVKSGFNSEDLNNSDQKAIMEISELKGELKARIQEANQAKNEVDRLQKQITEIDLTREAAEKETVVLEEKLKNQEIVFESKLGQSKSSLEIKIGKLNEQVKNLSDLLKDKEKSITELKNEKQKKQQALELVNHEKEKMVQKIESLQETVSALKDSQAASSQDNVVNLPTDDAIKKLKKALSDVTARDAQIKSLKSQNVKINEELSNALADKTKSESEYSELNGKLKGVRAEFEKKIQQSQAEWTTKTEALQKELSASKQKLTAKEDLVADLTVKMDGLTQRVGQLTRENENSKNVIPGISLESENFNVIKKERDNLKKQLTTSISESSQLKNQLQTLQKAEGQQKENIKNSAAKYQSEIASLKDDNAKQKVNLKEAITRADLSDKKNKQLQAQLLLAQNNKQTLPGSEQTLLRGQVNALNAQLKNMAYKTEQQEKLSKNINLKNNELNASLVALQKKLELKQKGFDDLTVEKNELAQKVTVLTKDRESLDGKLKELTQQIIQLQAVQNGEVSTVKNEASQKTAELAMKLAEAVGQIRTGELTIQQLNEKERNSQQQLAATIIAKSQSDEALLKNKQEIEGIRKEYQIQMDDLKQQALLFGNERDTQIIKVNELENSLKDEQKASKAAVDEVRIRLTSEIDTLKQTMSQKESQWLEFENANKELTAEKEGLIQQLADEHLKVVELQNQVNGKEDTSLESNHSIEKTLRDNIEDLTKKLSGTQAQLSEMKQSKDMLEQKLKLNDAKVEELQAQLSGMKQDKSTDLDNAQTRNNLRTEITQLTAKLKESQKSLEELTKTKNGLDENLAFSKQKISDLQTQLANNEKNTAEIMSQSEKEMIAAKENLQTEVKQLTQRLQETQKSVSELTQSKSVLEEDLKSKQVIIARMESEKAEKVKILTSANVQVSQQALDEKKGLEKQIQDLSAELKNAQSTIAVLTKSKENLDQQIKDSEIKMLQMTNDLTLKSQESENKLQDQQASAKASSDEMRARLTGEIDNLRQSLSQKETQSLEMEKTIKDLTSAQEKLNQQLVSVQTSDQQNQAKVQELQGKLNEKELESRESMSTLEKKLREKIDEVTAQLTQTQGQLTDINHVKEGLEENIKDKDAKVEELSAQITNKDKAMSELETKSAQEIADAKNSLGVQMEQLKINLQESKAAVSELTKTKSDLEKTSATVNVQVQELRSSLVEKEKALVEIKAKFADEIVETKKNLQLQVEQLTASLKESNQTIEELTKAKSVLEESISSSQSKVAELQTKVTENENLLAETKTKSSDEVNDLKTNLQFQLDELTNRLNESQGSVAELTKAKASLEDNLKTSEAKVTELQAQLSEKESSLVDVKNKSAQEITEARKNLQSELEKTANSLRDSQQAVSVLTKNKTEIEESLKIAHTQLTQMQTQVDENRKLLTEKTAEHTKELESLKQTLNAQLEESSSELKKAQDSQEQLRKIKGDVEADLKTAEEKVSKLTQELSKKQDDINLIQSGIPSQIATAKKPLEEKMDILVKTLGDTQSELKVKQSNLEEISGRVSGLEKTLAETKTAKEEIEKETVQVKADFEKARTEFSQEMEKATKSLKDQNNDLQKNLNDQDQKIVLLTAEKDQLTKALAQITADKQKLEQEVGKLKSEVSGQQKTIDEKVAQAKQPMLAQIAQLEKSIDEKEKLIAQKAEAFNKVSGELTTVLKGLAVVREERDNLSLSVKPLNDKINAFPQEIAQAKKPLEDENSQLHIELQKVQGMLDVRVKGLESDLEAKSAAYDQVSRERQDLDKEIARLNQVSDKLTQENERLNLKLSKKFQEDCGVAMEEIQKPWKDKIDELKSLLEGRDKEIESFKNENSRLNQELGSLAPSGK